MGLVDRLRNENRERVFKEILGKKYSDMDDYNISYSNSEEFLLITIKRLVLEGRIGKAEDELFNEIDRNKSINILYIACEFYAMLSDLPDTVLEKSNFSRQEIKDGIADIKDAFGTN